jgi:hypothetical protein
MSVSASLCVLLNQAIDYAGMFPPCGLPLKPALQNQATYVRSPEAWMLNGFVLPVQQFDAAKRLLSQFDAQHSLRLAALGPKTENPNSFFDVLKNAMSTIRSFPKYDIGLISVSHLEMFLPQDANTVTLKEAKSIAGEFPVFWEAPRDKAEQTIELLAEINSHDKIAPFGYKLRTGGVTADAFPSSVQIARALTMAATHQLPIKFTAGLHHPVRQFRDEVKTKMHGFLNVLGAAVLAAEYQWSADQTVMMLEEEDPRSFAFTDDFFAWRGWKINTESVRHRRTLVRSFGSCSFDEPREDLRALGFL